MSIYKQANTLEQRKALSTSLRSKYPDRVPIIAEVAKGSKLPPLIRNKYLAPDTTTMAKLVYDFRKNMTLKQEEAIFLFIGDTMQPTAALIGNVYEKCKDEDGFLYIQLQTENTFG